jgi:putative DNA primase/helicase
MRDNVKENCRGRWQSILVQLGFPHTALSGYNRPCPMCQGKDRFQFTDIDGKGTYHCRGCGGREGTGGGGDGFDLVMKYLGVNFTEAVKRIEDKIGTSKKSSGRDREAERDYARDQQAWLWRNSPGLTGEDAPSWYLASRKIMDLPPGHAARHAKHIKDVDPDTKAVTYWDAMVTRFVAPDESRAALHFTLLTVNGEKAPVKHVKQFIRGAVLPRGGAVRLMDPAEDMGVAEGIETALSAAAIWHMPVWAVLSTAGMLNFVPPAICRRLTVFADYDTKWAGQHAACSLAYRLATNTDTKLLVKWPTSPDFKDWNDELRARPDPSSNVVPLPLR